MKDPRVRFDTRTPFQLDLRRRIDAYLAVEGREQAGFRAIKIKTAILFAALAGGLAIGLSTTMIPLILLGALIAGLAMAGLGMSVQHDGGHRAYSRNPKLNKAAASVLDFLGASSYVWHYKHGVAHHTYPNMEGADEDIELRPIARMAPGQPHHWYHRMQQFYMPVLYGLINVKWFWSDDYRDLLRGRVGNTPIAKPRGADLAIFWAGKLVHLAWGVILPLAVLGLAKGLLFHFVMYFACGFTLALVFQLAHCVEEAEFIQLPESANGPVVERDFFAHQLATTVDFARDSRWVTWYVGGLNFQAVHHLVPRVCHIHYPGLAPIVEQCCAEHGVPYKSTPSLWTAIGSHFRWLRRMGRGETPALVVPEPESLPTPAVRAA
ncbi:fatty acid desaturase family protein [Nannocystaceae bacterium ST9]